MLYVMRDVFFEGRIILCKCGMLNIVVILGVFEMPKRGGLTFFFGFDMVSETRIVINILGRVLFIFLLFDSSKCSESKRMGSLFAVIAADILTE